MADEGSSAEEKTEPASQKKRDDSRRKGSVAKSMDLSAASGLIFGLVILYFGGAAIVVKLGDITRSSLTNMATVNLTIANVHSIIKEAIFSFTMILAPVLVAIMVVGLIVNYAQVGFKFTMEPLQPKFGKMNPLSGFKRVMLSKHSVMEIVKGLFKVVIVGFVAYNATNEVMAESFSLADSDVAAIMAFMAMVSWKVGLKVGLAFFVLAAGDYAFQRFEFEKSLRMTKQEVKEESKQSEGDPQIKSRIRTLQRQMAYRRMMQDVPKADVVVTNPTHFAVAIKYELGKMGAPRVVAKGADEIAQRIKEIAKEHHVPIVENKPLAQMLFKSVDIGGEVPEKLFQAVAQVLAYVYRLRDARQSKLNMN